MEQYSKMNMLVVDDDQLFLKKMTAYLHKFSENVNVSESAENGSYFVRKFEPVIIFLDNNLPKLKGLQVIEFYKELSPKSKIILMSAYITVDDVECAIQNKADYIVDKSNFGPEELYALMEAVLISNEKNSSVWSILKAVEYKIPGVLKVGMVEDDELFALNLERLLGKHCSNHLLTKYQYGKSFVNDLKTNTPDLVFLDYYLEDMTGDEVLSEIHYFYPKTKVVVISSLEDSKMAIELVNKGVDGYIVKDEFLESKLEEYLIKFGFAK